MNKLTYRIFREIELKKIIYFLFANLVAVFLMNVTFYVMVEGYQINSRPFVFIVTISLGLIPLVLVFYYKFFSSRIVSPSYKQNSQETVMPLKGPVGIEYKASFAIIIGTIIIGTIIIGTIIDPFIGMITTAGVSVGVILSLMGKRRVFMFLLLIIIGLLSILATSFLGMTADKTEMRLASFVVVDKQYIEPDGIFRVYLLYVGDTLESITKEDFEWYLNDRHMGSVHSVSIANTDGMKIKSGATLQIDLKIEEVPANTRIKLTFRDGYQIVFSI